MIRHRSSTLLLTPPGYFKSPDEGQKQEGRSLNVKTGKEESVSAALDRVAKTKGVPVTSIAMAYVHLKCNN
jgi:hypothetical protein